MDDTGIYVKISPVMSSLGFLHSSGRISDVSRMYLGRIAEM